ncbi:hypothetical protein COY26_04500 [Candidatus Woesearchaeota archaeon CG_4_10_14_0_2_um_filter_33_10]|nr:MAG: hypothetical protein COY26_04500 [Candidatus Woesearchaeota archaeon CG_4_10_14_0_2_um_filter_33_10]
MLSESLKIKKKVMVAMSGGIDSSLAAAMLKKRNVDIIGVFMRLWGISNSDNPTEIWNKSFFKEAEQKARETTSLLNIPFLVWNLEKEFRDKVINYFSSYENFNPCAMCNKEIRTELLLEKAVDWKIDYIATGHYARKIQAYNKYKLYRANDKKRDQSYLLWKLSQDQLKRLLFPIGDLTQSKIKSLAGRFRLPSIDFSMSAEACLLQATINDFLKNNNYKLSKDSRNKINNQYKGFPFSPLNKESKFNQWKKEFLLKKSNWISEKSPRLPIKVKVRIRHKNVLDTAIIDYIKNKIIKIVFNKPQIVIPSGQIVVFYKKEEVLGGGIIY